MWQQRNASAFAFFCNRRQLFLQKLLLAFFSHDIFYLQRCCHFISKWRKRKIPCFILTYIFYLFFTFFFLSLALRVCVYRLVSMMMWNAIYILNFLACAVGAGAHTHNEKEYAEIFNNVPWWFWLLFAFDSFYINGNIIKNERERATRTMLYLHIRILDSSKWCSKMVNTFRWHFAGLKLKTKEPKRQAFIRTLEN